MKMKRSKWVTFCYMLFVVILAFDFSRLAFAATGSISTNPWTDVIVQLGQGVGSVTINWQTSGCSTAQVYVAMDGGAEQLMAQSSSGNDIAPWIQAGHYYDFRLYAETGHTSPPLATVRVYGRLYEYSVGVCYQAISGDFGNDSFLSQYDDVRSTVQEQLRGMANAGATYIKTGIFMVGTSGTSGKPSDTWKLHFPLNSLELSNLQKYATDVAEIHADDGHMLRLDLTLSWMWDADYTQAKYDSQGHITNVGHSDLPTQTFTNDVISAYSGIVDSVFNVTRSDGVKVVDVVNFEGELTIGYKANLEWFLLTHYPGFVAYCRNNGLTPAVSFITEYDESKILDNWTDPEFSILNNHRSMYHVYRAIKFLKDNNLYIPARIDWSCYPNVINSTYDNLIQRICDDADATLPSLGARKWYGAAETFYFADSTTRRTLGLAWAAQRNMNDRVSRVNFWTTPTDSNLGFGYPFAVGDYIP